MKERLPATVLSGFLGAGKTSVLRHILQNRNGLKVALIVNDMSEINVDARQVLRDASLSRTDEKLVEMSNGCICCTLREDLLVEVDRLAREGRFDYLLIESTGIGEPIPVAQTFSYVDEALGIDLSAISRLDTMVTVVDAFHFFHDFGSADTLDERGLAEEGDRRTLVDLLTDQIEFANVIVVNKADLVDADHLGELRAFLRKFNPDAKIIYAEHGRVDLAAILNTGLFDFEKASSGAGWIRELENEHVPETEEYGIGSFVYRQRRPFHPQRFWDFLVHDFPAGILRSKGLFWIASRPSAALMWSQAGGSIKAEPAGNWWAAEHTLRNLPPEARDIIVPRWDSRFGDRLTEIVIIGQDLDREGIRAQFDACVCSDEEIRRIEDAIDLQDPWPEWASAPKELGRV